EQRAIIPSMASIPQTPTQDLIRRIQRIQAITIVWMSLEAAASLSAAWIGDSRYLNSAGKAVRIQSELRSQVKVSLSFTTALRLLPECSPPQITGLSLVSMTVRFLCHLQLSAKMSATSSFNRPHDRELLRIRFIFRQLNENSKWTESASVFMRFVLVKSP